MNPDGSPNPAMYAQQAQPPAYAPFPHAVQNPQVQPYLPQAAAPHLVFPPAAAAAPRAAPALAQAVPGAPPAGFAYPQAAAAAVAAAATTQPGAAAAVYAQPVAAQLAASVSMEQRSAALAMQQLSPVAGAEPLDDNADVEGGGDLSPRAQRKLSHNQVEVRRRRRISMQLDRLKSLLHCEKTDKASILSEAVTQITVHAPACPTRARSTTHRPPHF